jgi:hypothetical protein
LLAEGVAAMDGFRHEFSDAQSTLFTEIARRSDIFIDKLHTNGNILW